MSYYVTQMWKPRPAWLALSVEERRSYLEEKITPNLAAMRTSGTEMLACAVNDLGDTSEPTYLAVWQVADKAAAETLLAQIESTGFFEYFEELNLGGTSIPVAQIHEAMSGI